MNIFQLVISEVRHRKLNFALGLLSVSVAIGCLVAAQTVLKADRITTDQMLSARQAEVEAAIAEKESIVTKAGSDLQDAMRKHMIGLGFNVLILPEEQSLSEIHLNGTMTATMPESYVDKLAQSDIVTVNHLLPSVTRRVTWDEKDRDVILVGTRGEVPIHHRALKKQLLEEVAPGKMVIGHELHQDLGLNKDDVVLFQGKEFTVSQVHAQRGSADDVTVWINLREAQELLGLENLINAILALECDCAGDRISVIRREISAVLPGTQVIERYSQALARAEARAKAKEAAEAALAEEKAAGAAMLAREEDSRKQLEDRHAGLASILVPLTMLGSVVMIAILTFVNARRRSEEIGILRAIGLKARQVVLLFLSKAVAIGTAGGIAGTALGLAVGLNVAASGSAGVSDQLFSDGGLTMTILGAPVLAIVLTSLASWIPALMAAHRDPAVVLQGE